MSWFCYEPEDQLYLSRKLSTISIYFKVVIVVDEDQINSENPKYVGEVEVSLLELSKKKLKYYSLEKTDKILQIEVY